VRCLIDEQGAARAIRLHASSGYPLLDKAALIAVQDWQFMPETVNGRPVAVWVEVPVRFRIN
jgi:protein TonB